MSGSIGYSTLSIIPSAKNFGAKLSKDVDPQMHGAGTSGGKRFGSGMVSAAKSFAGPLAAAIGVGAGIKFFKDAVSGASDLSESASKVGVVFGSMAQQVLDTSKVSARAMGLSSAAYLDATGSLGNLLVSLSIAPKAAADMSQQMVQLAGDLASFNNVSPEDALAAIQSGLTGETEPLKRFGVNMNDATLKAQALSMGLIKTTKEAMSPQTKALAAQALIMAQTGTAQGDFARTSGGLANQQRILSAQTEDLKTKIGGGLLPIVTTITAGFNKFVTGIQEGTGAGGRLRDIVTDLNERAIQPAATFITGTAVPAVTAFVQGFRDGEGPGGSFRDLVFDIYDNAIRPTADFIAGTAVPAVRAFIQQFRDGTGPGGTFRDILKTVYDDGVKPIADFLRDTALPALGALEDWVYDKGIPALGSFARWLGDNTTAIRVVAGVITALLMPVLVALGVEAIQSGLLQVGAWLLTETTAVQSAAAQFASHYRVVAGWVMSAAAAIASGAETAAIWAMYKAESIAGAASTVGGLLVVAGGWISTAATATASGIAMAAAWVVGLGPVAWIVAAVVAIGAAMVLAYNKVSWFRDAVDAAWSWIKSAASAVGSWFTKTVPEWWNSVADSTSRIWGNVVGFFTGIPGKIMGVFSGAGSWLIDTGKNIIEGLLSGAGSLLSKIGSFFLDKVPAFIREPFKRALGINSPSTVFANYGENTVDGYLIGVDRRRGRLDATMSGLVVTPSVESPDFGSAPYGARANGRPGAGVVQNIYPTPGMSEQQVGDMSGRAVERVLTGVSR